MPTAVSERRTRSRRIRRGYSRRLLGDQVCEPRRVAAARSCWRRRSRSSSCTSPYQPGVAVGFGSTTVNAYLSDFAVLAVVARRARRGRRAAASRRSRPAGRSGSRSALFLVWMFVEVGLGHHHAAAYAWRTHARHRGEVRRVRAARARGCRCSSAARATSLLCAWSLVLWSVLATVVGIAQFFGADIFLAGTVGHRQASFLASADFAALSAAALLVGIVGLALPRVRAEPRARRDRARHAACSG